MLSGLLADTDESRDPKPSAIADLPLLPLFLAVLVGVMSLGIAIGDEALHVDELFQASSYAGDFGEIVDRATAQAQPPLDYLVGAGTERLLGPSDFARRLPAVVAGVWTLFAMGLLVRRIGAPDWIAVLLLALSPLFIEFSAYARPYAIPLALMVGFLLAVDRWRTHGSLWALGMSFGVGLLLPLSRTTEPALFLGFCLATFALIRLKGGPKVKWTRWPLTAAALGTTVAIAVMSTLSSEISKYDAGGVNDIPTIVERLSSDIARAYSEGLPWAGIAALLALGSLAYAVWMLYRGNVGIWWVVPVGLVAIAMPVAFAALADTDQAFQPRYTYFFWSAYAIGASLLVKVSGRRLGVAIALAMVALSVPATVIALRESHNPDYKNAGTRVLEAATEGDVIIWEWGRSHDEWRPTIFPGFELYFDSPSDFYSSEVVAAVGIEDGQRPMILAQELEKPPPGWTGVQVTAQFAVWIPDESAGEWEPVSQGEALRSVCRQVPADSGAATCAAAARLLIAGGDRKGGAELLAETEARLQSDSVRRRLEQWTQDLEQG